MRAERTFAFDVHLSSAPIFSLDNHEFADALAGRPSLIAVDKRVDKLYGEALRCYASKRLLVSDITTFAADERSKTLHGVAKLCEIAEKVKLPRNGVFVAVGGGITLDTVGTAAALYRRGVGYFRVPTTLVAGVDVCVGIKQGVNFRNHKNLLGAFYPPLGALCDRRFLATLPRREISCGIAEIIKVALLLDPVLFELLEQEGARLLATAFQDPPKVAETVIVRAQSAMMRELRANLWEYDLRRMVDFGHTFSPLIEEVSRYTVSHGYAVALDMLVSTAAAVVLGHCPRAILDRLITLYKKMELPLRHPACSLDVLISALPCARAHRAGALNLVIPTGLGSGTFILEISRETLAFALATIGDALAEAA